MLGIVAVALAGTVRDLAARVHPVFSRAFVAVVYLAIGPCLAIPRTSSTAYEMLLPLLPASVDPGLMRLAFSVAFFVLAYALAMHPGRITRLLGKITGPLLIVLIVAVVALRSFPRASRSRPPVPRTTQTQPCRAFLRAIRPWTCSRRSPLAW